MHHERRMIREEVSILGLGNVGLPTAAILASKGFRVHGTDTDNRILESVRLGRIPPYEPGLASLVESAVSTGFLTVDSVVTAADFFLIAVPTPCTNVESIPRADLTHVLGAVASILPHLRRGNMVILESTVPPGMTRDVIMPAVGKAGWRPGEDIGVAFCPERLMPGSALAELASNDRVIGADSPFWAAQAERLYRSFATGRIHHTTPTAAELVKLMENAYRDVNIALANELSVLCEKLDIDAWEAIGLANRHPRVHLHSPGPGVGGQCIGAASWFLAGAFPRETGLIQSARRVNESRPQHVVDRIRSLMRPSRKARIALLGMSYKGNVRDTLGSASLRVRQLLTEQEPQWEITSSDPYGGTGELPVQPIGEALQDADLAVVLTAHDEYRALDPKECARRMRGRIILDTQGILHQDAWNGAGFRLETIGRGREGSETDSGSLQAL